MQKKNRVVLNFPSHLQKWDSQSLLTGLELQGAPRHQTIMLHDLDIKCWVLLSCDSFTAYGGTSSASHILQAFVFQGCQFYDTTRCTAMLSQSSPVRFVESQLPFWVLFWCNLQLHSIKIPWHKCIYVTTEHTPKKHVSLENNARKKKIILYAWSVTSWEWDVQFWQFTEKMMLSHSHPFPLLTRTPGSVAFLNDKKLYFRSSQSLLRWTTGS